VLLLGFGAAADPHATLPGVPIYVDLFQPLASVPFSAAAGSTAIPIPIRRDRSLCTGLTFYIQALIADLDVPSGVPGPFPLVATNRVDWKIGNAPSLVITEIMHTPVTIPDADGEWFEIYNASPDPLDLDGWTIRDDGGDLHVIAGALPVMPGDYLVFAQNADPATNGGFVADYVLTGVELDPDDELEFVDPSGEVHDRVVWTGSFGPSIEATFPRLPGASLSLDPRLLNTGANDFGGNWCRGRSPYGPAMLGTPGSRNDYCP